MDKQKYSQSSGFTLIEVLIAMFVFSIGILGMGAMQVRAIQGNSHARQISEATNIAADQIEIIAGLTYTSLYTDPSLNDDHASGAAGLNSVTAADESLTTPDGHYQIFWNIKDDYPLTNAKTIRVIVRQTGQTKTVSLETIKLIQ